MGAQLDPAIGDHPALDVPVADDGIENRHGSAHLGVVGEERGAATLVEDRPGCRGGELPSDAADGFRRQVALFFGPLGGIGFQVRLQLFEADRPLGHKGCVVPSLADDHLEHRQDEGHVGTGPDRQPLVGLGSGFGKARVEVDQFALAARALEQVDGIGGDQGLAAVGAGHDDVVAVEDVRRRAGAKGGAEPLQIGRQAEGRMAHGVGGAEAFGQLQEEVLLERSLGGGEHHAGAGVLVRDGLHAARDQVERLLPTGSPPFPFAPLADPDQRVLEPVRIVDDLDSGVAAGAEHAPALDEVRVGIEFVDHAVTHPGDDPAFVDAHAAAGEDILPGHRRRRSDLAGFGKGTQDLDLRTDGHAGQRTGGESQEAPAAQFFF